MSAISSRSPDPNRDSANRVLLQALSGLSDRQVNALLEFINFWFGLAREEQAIFAKSARPDLRHSDIARLCGVTGRSVHNWLRYKEVKRRVEGFDHPSPPSKRRRSNRGGYWPIDHPER